jgi:hypothetical protein
VTAAADGCPRPSFDRPISGVYQLLGLPLGSGLETVLLNDEDYVLIGPRVLLTDGEETIPWIFTEVI